MAGVEKSDFGSPDETRTRDKARVEVVNVGGVTTSRFTAEPGWRWSESTKPLVGTASCQERHIGAVQAGRMRVAHEDGTVLKLEPGDAFVIEPGHDAEIVGEERFVAIEFQL